MFMLVGSTWYRMIYLYLAWVTILLGIILKFIIKNFLFVLSRMHAKHEIYVI